MKLYEWDFAPNCRRVRMFLFEKGIEIPREECITPAIALKDDFLDRYQHNMVPMLELDDGTQIGEALGIWTYLETMNPEPPLMGRTALEKATISAWERRAYSEHKYIHIQAAYLSEGFW
jgi:glutathione S-transferase